MKLPKMRFVVIQLAHAFMFKNKYKLEVIAISYNRNGKWALIGADSYVEVRLTDYTFDRNYDKLVSCHPLPLDGSYVKPQFVEPFNIGGETLMRVNYIKGGKYSKDAAFENVLYFEIVSDGRDGVNIMEYKYTPAQGFFYYPVDPEAFSFCYKGIESTIHKSFLAASKKILNWLDFLMLG